jgi:phosphate/phosphite/phosphonate ABC transporter binding protein
MKPRGRYDKGADRPPARRPRFGGGVQKILAAAFVLPAALINCGCGGGNSPGAQVVDPGELVFIFQKQKDPQNVEAHADVAVGFLSEQLGMPVRRQVPMNYAMAVHALVSEKADVAYLDSLAFLLARRDGDVELLLAEVRHDAAGRPRTDYDSIFVVARDNPLASMEDLVGEAAELRFVFTSEISTSGYLMAVRRMVNEGLIRPGQDPAEVFKTVAYAGGYSQALQQVLDGRGDVCAVSFYTMEGPSADVYLDQAQREKLRILARTPGVPTHLICVRRALSPGLKDRIKAALLKLSVRNPQVLADVYGAKQLIEVDENEHVAATVEAIEHAGIPVDGFIK